MKLVDPVRDYPSIFPPGAGRRYVAVRLRLTNVGERVYRGAPGDGATVTDARGRAYDSLWLPTVEPDLGTPVTIRVGDGIVGWTTFEMPKQATPRRFHLTLDFAKTGVWRLCARPAC